MERLIIQVTAEQKAMLAKLCGDEEISRAEVMRRALDEYLITHHSNIFAKDQAFGIWQDKKFDAVSYQRQLRDEW